LHPYIILLSLPLIGIVVFWLMPLPMAILVYLLILAVSGVLYWIMARAMKKRPRYGVEALINAEARVVTGLGPDADAQYLVKVRGELWRANSHDDLKLGETVKILSVNGLTLTVGRLPQIT
jgi:membrane protein implicated in regulation of membrane protease activity